MRIVNFDFMMTTELLILWLWPNALNWVSIIKVSGGDYILYEGSVITDMCTISEFITMSTAPLYFTL